MAVANFPPLAVAFLYSDQPFLKCEPKMSASNILGSDSQLPPFNSMSAVHSATLKKLGLRVYGSHGASCIESPQFNRVIILLNGTDDRELVQ